jgi:hypothetical protein
LRRRGHVWDAVEDREGAARGVVEHD